MSILKKILVTKRKEVKLLKTKKWDMTLLKQTPTFQELISGSKEMNMIAEIKRASPSKGAIQMNVDPVVQAKKYEALGAKAISVLTDSNYFNGSMDDLIAVRKAVDIPILCKDFIIDKVQIDQAKSAGANIILLIVAALNEKDLFSLFDYANKMELEVLCEVHNETEMKRALELGATLIGINNRNLKTFSVDLQTTNRLASMVSEPNITLISESGIRTRGDVIQVHDAGAHGILVGETLMRSDNLQETFEELLIPLTKKR